MGIGIGNKDLPGVETPLDEIFTASIDFYSELAEVEGIIELQRLTPNTTCRDEEG